MREHWINCFVNRWALPSANLFMGCIQKTLNADLWLQLGVIYTITLSTSSHQTVKLHRAISHDHIPGWTSDTTMCSDVAMNVCVETSFCKGSTVVVFKRIQTHYLVVYIYHYIVLAMMAGDSWHSSILISESSFIFADELNKIRHYLTSPVPCLKGSTNTNLQ